MCFSWVDYEMADGKLNVRTSQGQSLDLNSGKLFTPKNKPTYIGVNRFYSTSAWKGSGVCKIECQTLESGGSAVQGSAGRFNGRDTLIGPGEMANFATQRSNRQ